MDLEKANPASPVSNSSSTFSENRHHREMLNNEELLQPTSVASLANSVGGCNKRRDSRQSSTGSSQPAMRSSRSLSSPLSSDNEDDCKSIGSDTKTKSSGSEDEKMEQSPSHMRSRIKSGSSKRSSASSNASRCHSRSNSKDLTIDNGSFNINHDDLSDVSDMESVKKDSFNSSQRAIIEEKSNGSVSTEHPTRCEPENEKETILIDDDTNDRTGVTDLRQKLDQKKNKLKSMETVDKANVCNSTVNRNSADVIEDLVKPHDEDALDFEAEEGECQEVGKDGYIFDEKANDLESKETETANDKTDKDLELEEGEVTDEEEKRPEETEPKPICRFYTRGQCTWGMSCRFLHPGVTDKGNYTMFDLVRAVPVQGGISSSRPGSTYISHSSDYNEFRTERPMLQQRAPNLHSHSASTAAYPIHSDSRALATSLLPGGPVLVESAWERGLRTAKEMMRKANKRKEQDMDFEDKKMNLTLSPDELEKDPYYLKERVTPPKIVSAYSRHAPLPDVPSAVYNSPDRFGRGLPVPSFDEIDLYGRSSRYRELPPHRMPHYEDERRVRPTREVIVQRVEQIGRADEWNDPWMRSKSPGGRGASPRNDKRRRDRCYSSNSYSTSSSSESESSSESSHSPTPSGQNRHYNSTSYKSLVRRRTKTASSPTLSQKRGRSPNIRRSPVAKRPVLMSQSPVVDKKSSSAFYRRKKPLSKKSLKDKMKGKRRLTSSSTSGTGSSDSSASGSESNSASSTSSSISKERLFSKRGRALEKISNTERNVAKKEPPKKRSPISIEIKKLATVGASALISPAGSISPEKDSKKTRREELLKQLRAVEDAIAKKRSKLT